MMSKLIKPFKVNEIWGLGFRVYYGDDFVSTTPFEKEAYSFFSKNQNDPTFGIPIHNYCKRINQVYKQNDDELIKLKHALEESKEFKDIEIKDSSSAIGLPKIVVYTHIKTNIKTEFDGLVFVSELKISDETFSIEDGINFIETQKDPYLLDIVQTGSTLTSIGRKLLNNASAHCKWMYATSSVDFCSNKFDLGEIMQIENLIFSIHLIDKNIVHFTMPTQTFEESERYYFLIGSRSHIREVVAHDYETFRYLKFLEERLKSIRDDILKIQDNLFHEVPLLTWSLNLLAWGKAISYATSLQRSLEKIVRYRLYLPSFAAVIQAYADFEAQGIGFYNLPCPLFSEGQKMNQTQYPTPSPYRLEIKNSKIIVWENDITFRVFENEPESLNNFHLSIQTLVEETFILLQAITVTPALHTGMVSALVALLAMFISILVFALPFTLEKMSPLFQPKDVSAPQKSVKSSDNEKHKLLPQQSIGKSQLKQSIMPKRTEKASTQKSPTMPTLISKPILKP